MIIINNSLVFFRKKSNIQTTEVAKEGIKKVDTVVTGLILGGLIASIYGIKKIRDAHEEKEDHENTEAPTDLHEHPKKIGEK